MQLDNDTPTLEKINLYTTWPKGNTKKVPSVISYSRTLNGNKQWGHDIDLNSEVMRWTKLEFQPQQRLAELERLRDTVKGLSLMAAFQTNMNAGIDNDVPYHLGLGAEDIARDFLQKVTREWFHHMEGISARVLQNAPIDLIITHPGVSDNVRQP
jgi:hypothetical protein